MLLESNALLINFACFEAVKNKGVLQLHETILFQTHHIENLEFFFDSKRRLETKSWITEIEQNGVLLEAVVQRCSVKNLFL